MPRYVAFLRGVMPTNAKMPELRRAFAAAGFSEVVTVLGSGNVVFDAPRAQEATLERRAEKAMEQQLDRVFLTIIRSQSALAELIAADPFARFRLPPQAKRVVTFLRAPHRGKLALPLERDGGRILALARREACTTYMPGKTGPGFMKLIEDTFGKDVTTRTWDTIRKCAVK